ncbi:MAG: TSUP family transporter [Candidatus Edwardsbacteria bacterium]|nr:TSUP family transporter [Candidatus Edwardsbacteria bacterium]
MISWHTYLIVLPAVFFAGFVDAIAGGGGLISIPAYLAAGLPPHFALGNNKFSSSFGTLFATLRYHQEKLIDLPVALLSAAFALAGSFAGTKTVLLVDPGFLRYVLIALIPLITMFTFVNQDMGRHDRSGTVGKRPKYLLAAGAALLIGFYDGFFGPGTGTFLILFYTALLKYDFVTANANTKVVNLASNVAAAVTFIAAGKVLYAVGIPAAACGIVGNLLGARVAIRNGAKAIRPIFIGVLVLLFAKIVYDLIVSHF